MKSASRPAPKRAVSPPRKAKPAAADGLAQANQSVINAFAVLQTVMGASGPIGSREVSRQVGLEHTRVNRSLRTLAFLGLVAQSDNSKYIPGASIHVLAAQSLLNSGLLPVTLPHLEKLREPGFTVSLGLLSGDRICFLIHTRPWQKLDEGIGSHALHPARSSSLGMVLLAARDDAQLPPELRGDEALLRELARVRRRGSAVVKFPNGQISVAVCIGSPAVAAIGASKENLTETEIEKLSRALRLAADAITTELGEFYGRTHTPRPVWSEREVI
jgi:DNA-binding IclR family transcriptional regulator